ncbi:Paratox [Streptococcus agalactiae]|nr:Paratox [Streptococcus agalactiae]
MLYIDEFKEEIDKGYISGDTVAIVRKNGKIFDYVLPHEKVRDDEVVAVESVEDVLAELGNVRCDISSCQ